MDGLSKEHWDAFVRENVPLGRAAEDYELGRFMAWLCGPDAAYLTGQSINFDGGVVMW
jgi:meso-butanediol dehydrogenase/(S,S)-butanediol dehydrogenase/diacetyl reductase